MARDGRKGLGPGADKGRVQHQLSMLEGILRMCSWLRSMLMTESFSINCLLKASFSRTRSVTDVSSNLSSCMINCFRDINCALRSSTSERPSLITFSCSFLLLAAALNGLGLWGLEGDGWVKCCECWLCSDRD
ncbi:hypothetical protein PENTCL1PPCAC_16742 [Pristionchus entomophagus]|uniref:Ribosomal protein n=1 Tax=Pristionchus entomophagus TaxID=358040 RepID=A0AAV5TK41_9BILA|nr:hypothetical protein PENTCL1PPCAC_16742 [Pristionchus entomophagus]